ncbi:Imm32 family immunity protein [Lentzea sp. NPDC055074]
MNDLPEISYSARTSECELEATTACFERIADLIDSGAGRIAAAVHDPAPYDTALAGLTVRRSNGLVRVLVSDQELVVEGGAESLAVLADSLRGPVDLVNGRYHVHIEYFPDHFYLAEDSHPLVVSWVA